LKDQKTNDLASRLRNDEINAFNTLYWEYHAAVYANALKLIKDPGNCGRHSSGRHLLQYGESDILLTLTKILRLAIRISYHKTIDQLKRKLKEVLAP
jgi:hypothetical protein